MGSPLFSFSPFWGFFCVCVWVCECKSIISLTLEWKEPLRESSERIFTLDLPWFFRTLTQTYSKSDFLLPLWDVGVIKWEVVLKMYYAGLIADVHICQLGTTSKTLGSVGASFLRDHRRKCDRLYYLCSFYEMVMGQENKFRSLHRLQSLCVSWCSRTWRSKQSARIWWLQTYLVLTEWLCCCEAPRPSRWRIHSHVSTRDCCPSPSATVPGSHLPRACLWSL